MKKLMIAVAIVCAATMSQAYQVQWGASFMGVPQAADVTKDQTGIKTTMQSTMFAAGALDLTVYWVGTEANQLIGTYTLDSAGGVSGKSLGDGESDLYKAMLADHGSSWKPQYAVTATYTTADGVYTFSGTATATKALSAIGTGNILATMAGPAGSWDYKANAVPEPTSGLLLLLGVAGLALRRRRA